MVSTGYRGLPCQLFHAGIIELWCSVVDVFVLASDAPREIPGNAKVLSDRMVVISISCTVFASFHLYGLGTKNESVLEKWGNDLCVQSYMFVSTYILSW